MGSSNENGRSDWIRTSDLHPPRMLRYQAALHSEYIIHNFFNPALSSVKKASIYVNKIAALHQNAPREARIFNNLGGAHDHLPTINLKIA